jgi:hypothetical protein
MVSVYDGQRCLGWVIERGGAGFESFDAAEKSLGVFTTKDAAINKLTSNGGDR